jgi:rhodanese-related sulfurtransferase
MNKNGAGSFEKVVRGSLRLLETDAFIQLHNEGAIVLDTRDSMDFAAGFIPGSMNIGLNGDFAVWAGTLITPGTPMLLVCEPGREKEAITRLARIGYDQVKGYLDGGIKVWFKAGERYDRILTFTGEESQQLLNDGEYKLLDVRNRRETAVNRITGAVHVPLNLLKDHVDTLSKNDKWLIYCAGGYRSMVAASMLKAAGFHFVASIEGGIKEVMHRVPQLIEINENEESW